MMVYAQFLMRKSTKIQKSARGLTVKILTRVEKKAAYSDILLAETLKTSKLSPQDKRLTTILTYGVLRYQNQLDWYIQQTASVPLSKISIDIKIILRSAIYQIFHLDRIPAHAAIHEAVNLAHFFHPKASGFVNAVLRKIQLKYQSPLFAQLKNNSLSQICLSFAHPPWMVKRWLHRYGLKECLTLLGANNCPPPLTIRINTLKVPLTQVNTFLSELKELRPTPLQEGFSTEGPKPLIDTSSFEHGYFEIQGLSSMLVSHILDPQPGEKILDACAGRGGKSTHLAQLMNNKGVIVSLDPFFHKISALAGKAHRLGITILQPICADLLSNPFCQTFDRVLVDAPCSSMGIIRKHPEIKWQRKEPELSALSSLQMNILENSSHLVKSNGILVYSTCSTEKEETDVVLSQFLDQNPVFQVVSCLEEIPENLHSAVGKDGFLRILPHPHGMDGFFIAKLKKDRINMI